MNATPPEAKTEYSRGSALPKPVPRGARLAGFAILGAGAIGAVLLLVAEFTTLFVIRTAAAAPVKSVGAGSHHSYALLPIALLAALFTIVVFTLGSRPALLAIGVLGVIALLIALLGDLPDAHASGLVGTPSSHYVSATSSPSAGFYMETLGAVLLVISSASGFLLLGPPPRTRRRARPPSSDAAAPGSRATA